MEIEVKIKVEDQQIQDLLSCALEGGSNYWYFINAYRYPEGKTKKDVEFAHLELPMMEGGGIQIVDKEAMEGGEYYADNAAVDATWLTRDILPKGISVMAEKYPWHYENFAKDNCDAETGDVFLQCCLFGKLVFG